MEIEVRQEIGSDKPCLKGSLNQIHSLKCEIEQYSIDKIPCLEVELEPQQTVRAKITPSIQLRADLKFPTMVELPSEEIPEYEGDYTVVPRAHSQVTLETKNKVMRSDVKVVKIPYYETGNLSGGYTIYIAEDINNG